MRCAAELSEKRSPDDRGGHPAPSGGHGAAHLAGERSGRRGDGTVPAGAGGLFALRHAGDGGRLGGGHPPDGRRAGPQPGGGPGDASPSPAGGGRAGRAGAGGAVRAGGPCRKMVAGRCPGSGGAACLVAGPAVDGGVVGTAGLFHRPAAGGAKRPEPAGRTDCPHRHRLLCAGAGRRPRLGRGRALHGSAGRNGGQRGRQHRADGTFLP